ncbi:hypothetical protein [Nitrosomonas communis]|uniref:hypothetical protein n=1 Tax=Nitrosomonas communis TaxID=44574 RepID=UPI0015A6EA0D|nr:hypothetical protein [Nitrosomonas communis]
MAEHQIGRKADGMFLLYMLMDVLVFFIGLFAISLQIPKKEGSMIIIWLLFFLAPRTTE